jgi:hypothetical protein
MSRPEDVVSNKLFKVVTGCLIVALGFALYSRAYYKYTTDYYKSDAYYWQEYARRNR